MPPIRRRFATLLRELADVIERDSADLCESVVDQYHSPLGRRRHLELVREGKLKGYKPDRVHVFVEVSDIMAYLKKHPAIAAPVEAQTDMRERDPHRIAKLLRAELGLVPTRKRA